MRRTVARWVLVALAFVLVERSAGAAVFTVTRTDDQLDTNPGDGACVAQNGGGCSLRAAVQEANALSGADGIYLPAGTYSLTRGGAGENLAATGDLDITSAVTLLGDGWWATTIAMDAFDDRVFQVQGFANLTLGDLTVSGGSVDGRGGAIHVETGGILSLARARLQSCFARQGGGVAVDGGSATIEDTEIRYNYVISDIPQGNFASGAALWSDASTVVVRRSSFHDNVRDSDRNAIFVRDSSLTVQASTIIDNVSNSYALGAQDSDLTIVSSTFGRFDLGLTPGTGSGSLALGCSLVEVCTTQGYAYTSYGFNVFLNGLDCVGTGDTDGDWNLEPLMAPPGKFPARVPNRYSAALDGGHSFVCLPDDQWGQTRPHDDDGNGVAIIDVGAIEAYLIFTDGFESGDTSAW